MCVDFTNFSKSCIKDSFSLLQVGQIIDTTARHEKLNFMDAFSNYNKIPMYETN